VEPARRAPSFASRWLDSLVPVETSGRNVGDIPWALLGVALALAASSALAGWLLFAPPLAYWYG
jgi:hypothetical protein